MIRCSFKKGLKFIEQSVRWELQRRLVTRMLQFENENGEIKNLGDKEVHELWLNGQWSIDVKSLGTQADIIYLATPRDLSTFPEKWQKVALRRQHYIQSINPESNKYNIDLWKSLIEQASIEIKDDLPPAPNTVHGWWKRYRITKSIHSLIPKSLSGRQIKKPEIYSVFEDVISEVYLTLQKRPKSDVVQAMQHRVYNLNKSRESAEQIKCPGRSTIYRWLDELQHDLVDGARLGAEATRKKYRVAMGGLKVDFPLDRIEIDHTPINLLVIDKKTMLPLGKPWLTLAIDKKTRMILGFYISFNTPSAHSILQCLKMGFLPKVNIIKRFPDIKGDWPIYGIPLLIACDNGMELHSDALKKFCQELGIQLLFCPAKQPEHKGSIERFFRTIAIDLFHKIPGSVFSNITQRGDYPSEELAALDLETLIHLVTKWIVDIYSVSYHRGINTTPLLAWYEYSKNLNIELPAFPQELDVIAGIPAQRTVFHYGIELEGLHYNSKRLQELRRRTGENLQVLLKFNMDTISYIQVYDEHEREYIRVDCVNDDYADGLRRDVHGLIREYARRKFNENYSTVQLMEARTAVEAIIKEAFKHKKMVIRKKGAASVMHDSKSVFESENPLQMAQMPIKSAKYAIPEALPDGLNDPLPQFSFQDLPSLDLNDGEES